MIRSILGDEEDSDRHLYTRAKPALNYRLPVVLSSRMVIVVLVLVSGANRGHSTTALRSTNKFSYVERIYLANHISVGTSQRIKYTLMRARLGDLMRARLGMRHSPDTIYPTGRLQAATRALDITSSRFAEDLCRSMIESCGQCMAMIFGLSSFFDNHRPSSMHICAFEVAPFYIFIDYRRTIFIDFRKCCMVLNMSCVVALTHRAWSSVCDENHLYDVRPYHHRPEGAHLYVGIVIKLPI